MGHGSSSSTNKGAGRASYAWRVSHSSFSLQEERTCSTLLSGRAEYTKERDIITLIPTIHNYQDIKTFYTITNQQTYK